MNSGPSREAVELSALSQGIDLNVVSKFNIAQGFDWSEAPLIPWIAGVFPTESTYHPLIVSNDYEIATNLFSIEGSGLPEEKKDSIDQAALQMTYIKAGMGSNASLLGSAMGAFAGVAFGNLLKN